jgi:hypothetical protein
MPTSKVDFGVNRTWRYLLKLQGNVKELIVQIEKVNEAENAAYGKRDLEVMGSEEPLDSQKLEQKIHELNQRPKAQSDKPQEPSAGAAKAEVLLHTRTESLQTQEEEMSLG